MYKTHNVRICQGEQVEYHWFIWASIRRFYQAIEVHPSPLSRFPSSQLIKSFYLKFTPSPHFIRKSLFLVKKIFTNTELSVRIFDRKCCIVACLYFNDPNQQKFANIHLDIVGISETLLNKIFIVWSKCIVWGWIKIQSRSQSLQWLVVSHLSNNW